MAQKRQPKWNIYEAIILLEGYLDMQTKKASRLSIIKRVSADLRQMAINCGLDIDDTYRNENGISYQIQKMDSAYQDRKIYISATKLFTETVDLYRNDRSQYKKLLKEAQDKIASHASSEGSGGQFSTDIPASFEKALLEAAEFILTTTFSNGMRKNALIPKKKFRKAFLDLTGHELPENVDIDALASTAGYEYADKIYAISENNQEQIRRLVSDAISKGNRAIFYGELYQKNAGFMTNAGIYSPDMLQAVLKQILPEMHYRRKFFSPGADDALEHDILSCFDDTIMIPFRDIKKRLPYADLTQLKLACGHDCRFIWTREETCVLTEKLNLSPDDVDESRNSVQADIEKQGFSVFQRLTVTRSMELNPNVSEGVLKEALYIRCLAGDYERKHSIITLPGDSFSVSVVMREYCRGIREAAIDDLTTYERKLTDRAVYSLTAACDTMLRIDQERFVSLDAVNFDVQGVDNAIALFVQNEIVPLRSVRSFTSFPDPEGYSWNLFLLDSYCRHKSKRFRSMGGPAKSKPVGAIFPIWMQPESYEDLLAIAAAKSGLPLTAENVGAFLIENAYTLRRTNFNRIIAKAQEIRTREE